MVPAVATALAVVAPAQPAVLPQATTSQVATSLPCTHLSTASAATLPSGPAPVPCPPPSFVLGSLEIPLPDDAGSDTEETPAPQWETVTVAGHQQPVRWLPKNRPWTLPECTVTVRPRNSRRFWEAVKLWALEAGNWALLKKVGMPEGAGGPVQDQAAATAPQEGVLVDQGNSETSRGLSKPILCSRLSQIQVNLIGMMLLHGG